MHWGCILVNYPYDFVDIIGIIGQIPEFIHDFMANMLSEKHYSMGHQTSLHKCGDGGYSLVVMALWVHISYIMYNFMVFTRIRTLDVKPLWPN